eukprot:SAG31_NODE_1620_length_7725_cov_1.520850_6_plen_294_part_00
MEAIVSVGDRLQLRWPIFAIGPMVGQSDAPFRLLCRRHGASLVYSEMLMATNFATDEAYRRDGLGLDATTGKGCYFLVFVQLFEKYGTLIERNTALIERVPSPCRATARSRPPDGGAICSEHARILPGRGSCCAGLWRRRSRLEVSLVLAPTPPSAQPKVAVCVHCSLGCPQDRARSGHYGSWLTDPKDWGLCCKIVRVCRDCPRLTIPVTCKIRLQSTASATVDFARQLEFAGCALLAVHGRVRGSERERRGGPADLATIAAVKTALSIPVLSNGNIFGQHDVRPSTPPALM